MARKPICFVSYAQVDSAFVYDNLIPALNNLDVDILIPGEQVDFEYTLFDAIVEGIKKADFVVTLVNPRSTYVNLEIGVALGNAKPIIAVTNGYYELPSELLNLKYIRFDNYQDFLRVISFAVENVLDNVIDNATLAYNKRVKIIGIQVSSGNRNFPAELEFTLEIVDFIQQIIGDSRINFVQSSKGSLKSLISIDLKSWAELLEKIIFFIPELEKRKSERVKIEVEMDKMRAETEKIKAETRQVDVETGIKQTEAFLNILEKGEKLGLKLQVDNDLLVTQNQNGQLIFKVPKQIGSGQ